MIQVQNKRIGYFDYLRILSCLAIVLLHSTSTFQSQSGISYYLSGVLNNVTRFGVPVFIMISGALMLDENKQISTKSVFFKYIKNILILIVFWNVFYTIAYTIILPLVRGGNTINIKSVIGFLLFGEGHMWFLYMIIGLYLITPFLRSFVCLANKNAVLGFILVSIVFSFSRPILSIIDTVFPFVEEVNKFLDLFHLDFFGGYIAYYLLGWYLHNFELKKLHKIIIFIAAIVGLALMIMFIFVLPNLVDVINSNICIFTLLLALGAFLFGKTFLNSQRSLAKISSLSFGVYVIHPFFIFLLNTIFPYSGVLICVIKWIVVSIVSFLITFLLSKIPYIKKVVKC